MKTNRPFEKTRYPSEAETIERRNAKLGCLFIAVICIAGWSLIASVIYLLTL